MQHLESVLQREFQIKEDQDGKRILRSVGKSPASQEVVYRLLPIGLSKIPFFRPAELQVQPASQSDPNRPARFSRVVVLRKSVSVANKTT